MPNNPRDVFARVIYLSEPLKLPDDTPLSTMLSAKEPTLGDLKKLLGEPFCTQVRNVYPRPDIQNGRYQHYKGGLYDVYGVSQHESTGAWYVLYRNPSSGLCFHRLASEWADDMNGVPRFKLVG